MTTPAERTAAVIETRRFIVSLENKQERTFTAEQKAALRYAFRHLPTIGELELTHAKCPELWGKP